MSRLTFREKCPTVCWQKQLRDKYLAEGAPPVPHLDVKKAIVRPVTRKLAEQIILKYEWLGTLPATRWHYGIFYGNYCAGVTCVGGMSVIAGPYAHNTFGVTQGELLILARGACVHWAPKGTNSRLVSLTCRLLAKDTGAKVLLAYSDTDAGEVGTIYQSSNWVYIGRGIGRHLELIAPSGRILNEQIVGKMGKQNGLSYSEQLELLRRVGWSTQKVNPKHRYVYVLDKTDKALIDRVERMRQPYPKRPASIDSDAPVFHAGEGSAHLTAGLESAANR